MNPYTVSHTSREKKKKKNRNWCIDNKKPGSTFRPGPIKILWASALFSLNASESILQEQNPLMSPSGEKLRPSERNMVIRH